MTGIVIIRRTDRVAVVTDGCVFARPGNEMHSLMSKALPIPHLGCVIAARGSPTILAVVFNMTSEARSFDDLRARLPAIMRQVPTFLEATGEPAAFDLYVAGWSKSGTEAFSITTHDLYPGVAAFQIVPIDQVAAAPASAEIFAAGILPSGAADMDDIEPATYGLEVMEAQRRAISEVPGGFPGHIVGGFAQLTEVYRDRIEQRILRTWPDEIGKIIDPFSHGSPTA